jgi:hypothetical protein
MDGTENPKGLSSEGQTSEGETQGTSKQTKTYTEEELQKAKSDALAQAGRDAKAFSEREAALKAEKDAIEAEKTKIADWQRQREQAELDEARKDPDKLAQWQKRQQEKTRDAEFAKREADLNKRQVDLTKREAEHEAEITSAREAKLEMKVFELAGKYNLNPIVLKDGMKDLGLSTPEQAEALAKRLSETGKRPPEGEALKPASGVTSGGGKLTNEQLDKLPMEDYAAHRKKETSS